MHKTTNKHFKMFQAECSRWIDFLGLYEYRIEFEHDPTNMEDSTFGWCAADTENGVATLALGMYSHDPISDDFVISTARHEVLELLMWPLYETANRRYTTMVALNQARHSIIRRLESVLDRTT